jgi:hypothetical protein
MDISVKTVGNKPVARGVFHAIGILATAVRNNTLDFIDVTTAIGAGYQPLFGWISGLDHIFAV